MCGKMINIFNKAVEFSSSKKDTFECLLGSLYGQFTTGYQVIKELPEEKVTSICIENETITGDESISAPISFEVCADDLDELEQTYEKLCQVTSSTYTIVIEKYEEASTVHIIISPRD